MSRVVVGIATCRNPAGLAELLDAVNRQTRLPDKVIVIDNDPGRQGLDAVARFRDIAGFPIDARFESRAGIPFARNAVVGAAIADGADFLIMIDDDEIPPPNWIADLLDTARSLQADVVGGPVVPVFDDRLPEPLRETDFLKPGGRRLAAGEIVIESTANVLFSTAVFRRLGGGWFREDFAATGGSDTELLWRSRTSGDRHGIAGAAVVRERIPVWRATPAWLINRSYRTGNGLARIRILQSGWLRALATEAVNVAGLMGRIVLCLLKGRLSRRARFEARCGAWRISGKIAAFRGRAYAEYSVERYR